MIAAVSASMADRRSLLFVRRACRNSPGAAFEPRLSVSARTCLGAVWRMSMRD